MRRRLACTLMVLVTLASMQAAASGQSTESTRRERERVRQRRAQAAAQLDLLRSEDAEVEKALAAMNAHVSTQATLLQGAKREVAQAERQLFGAKANEQRTLNEIADLESVIKERAIQAYTGGGRPDDIESIVSSGDVNNATRRTAFADVIFGNARDTEDRLGASREDLTIAREEAQKAAGIANARKAEVAQRLGQVSQSRDRQAAFADQLDARIEARLAEAASLGQLEQQLSAEITRRQESLARNNQGSRGTVSGSLPPAGNVPLRNVRGIWVHESIGDQLARLLAAADGAGISLGGGGYRNPSDQQRLREANCPDPQNSPASSCRPPTARPGQSMHERGLAIDFTYGGRVIQSRSSPAYKWLDNNAGRFGLANLPSEPWHWSTSGN